MNWATILLVAAGVVGVLVTAAIGAVVVLLVRTERLAKDAVPRLAALACPACGVAIGAETAAAVERTRKAEGQRIWDEAKRKGTAIPRTDFRWRFTCRACGATLNFDAGAPREALSETR